MACAIATLVLLLAPPSPVNAQDAAPAFVVDGYRTKANAGDTKAQFRLAVLYERGMIGGTPDLAAAAMWYDRAAQGGHVTAQFKRARMHASGIAGPQDIPAAAALYLKAAEQGLAEAQYNLAILLQDGAGIDRDLTNAIHWFEQAAFRGVEPAMRALGLLYLSEVRQTPQDDIEAWAWLTLAADSGDGYAQIQAKQLQSEMSETAIKEAQQLAEAYRQLSLSQ